MKLHGYAVAKKKEGNLFIVHLPQEVKENPGTYVNAEEKYFYSNWDNFLPKSQIGKVQKDIYATRIKYLVYLLEDDEEKAMSLIKQTIQEEIDELNKQISFKQEILGIVCEPVCEIKER